MGGVTATVLFERILQRKYELNNFHEWIIITVNEIEEETGLNSTEQRLARKKLIERSLLKERLVNNDATIIEFWVDIDVFEAILAEFSSLHSKDKQSKIAIDSRENGYPKTTPIVEFVDNSHTIKQPIKNDKYFPVQRQPIAVKVTADYRFNGPWNSPEQFEEFQRSLLEHFKSQGDKNPAESVFWTIDRMTKGIISPFWEDFLQGIPFGESQKVKRDWEIEPGVPYPAFEEERIQYYVQKGEPLEVAVAKARGELRDPVLGKDLWEGFLRKCDRIADNALKAKQLGVANPYMPPSFTDKPQVTKESVMQKLEAIAPKLSLASSSYNEINNINLEEEEKTDTVSNVPSLISLQSAYKTSMGRTLVEKQIAEHPEWGYGIVNGEVVDLFPF